jgi:hypothetical protein
MVDHVRRQAVSAELGFGAETATMIRRLRTIVPAMLVGVGLALGAGILDSVFANQYDTLNKGPKVGTTIPHMLKSIDHRNQYQDFKSLARRRGLIILFSRSLDW